MLKVSMTQNFLLAFCDNSMARQWVPGPLHSKGKIRVFLLQDELFAHVIHSAGVSKYGHHAAQAQENSLDSGATNKAVFILERKRSANEYVAMVTS